MTNELGEGGKVNRAIIGQCMYLLKRWDQGESIIELVVESYNGHKSINFYQNFIKEKATQCEVGIRMVKNA